MKRLAQLPLLALLCLSSRTASAQAEVAFTRMVMPADVLLASAARAEEPVEAAAPRLFQGVVKDQHGVLPGATVWLQGTTQVAVANAEGIFQLFVPADQKEARVTCSFAGLESENATLALTSLGAEQPTVYLRRPLPAARRHGKHHRFSRRFRPARVKAAHKPRA